MGRKAVNIDGNLGGITVTPKNQRCCMVDQRFPTGAIHADLLLPQNALAHHQPYVWWAASRCCRESIAAIALLASKDHI